MAMFPWDRKPTDDEVPGPRLANGAYPPSAPLLGPKPLRTLEWRAIMEALPDLPYLVAELGLVAGGGAPHLIAGYGYSGKSVAMQSMLLSMATGRAIWGAYRCRDPLRVIHVDFEQGERLTRERYQRLSRAMRLEAEHIEDRLLLVEMPDLALIPEHRDRWLAILEGRSFLLIDSLRSACPGIDENSSDMRRPMDMLGGLGEATGCRALILHHARKPPSEGPSGGRYSIRGSSAIFDGSDAAFVFSGEKGEPVKVSQERARSHGHECEDFALVISDVEGGDDPDLVKRARWGLSVDVRGRELIEERRAIKTAQSQAARASDDAKQLRKLLQDKPRLGSTAIRGLMRWDGGRFAAACHNLGSELEVRMEILTPGVPGARASACHYIRGGGGHGGGG